MPIVESDEQLRQVLTDYRRIAIIGLSADPARASHQVAKYLIRQGYEVSGVNPPLKGTSILGCRVYGALSELPQAPEIVDVFRRSEFVAGVAEEAIAAGARVLWTQLGVRDDSAARRASEAGLYVVQNRCTKIEHRRLGIEALRGENEPQTDTNG